MNQRVRETLSALMDGESSEFETRRVLKSLLDEAPEEADTWRRYHAARSIMRGERNIDTTIDLSASIRASIANETMLAPEGPREGQKRATPFSFMGSAAIAAAVSLMVMTGVQVYRANTGLESVPANTADFASRNAESGDPGAFNEGGSLASLAAFRAPDQNAGATVMPIGAGSSWFTAPGEQDTSRGDRQQAQVLQGYLNQHVEQAGYRSSAWMSGMQGLAPASGE